MPTHTEPFEPAGRQFSGEEAAAPQAEPVMQRPDGRRAVAAIGPDPAAGPRLIDGAREAVELLAASYVAEGKSIPDAVRLAADQLVFNHPDIVAELRGERVSDRRQGSVGSATGRLTALAGPFGSAEDNGAAKPDARVNERFDVREESANDGRAVRGAVEGASPAQSGLPPTPKQKPIAPPPPKQKPPVQLPPPTLSEITPLTPAELNALRGPVVLTPANDPLPQSHIPLRFRNAVAKRESRDRGYQAYNPWDGGVWGRYQLTKTGRIQIGLERADGSLTGKYGVHSFQDFMNDPIAQERAFLDYILDNANQLWSNRAVDFIGQEIDGILAKFTITMDGLVAAAHRWGAEGTKTYLVHLQKHGWKSDASTFPVKKEKRFKAIETRLREFENISYLKIR